ncbi:hypothetical protein ACRAVF_08625 [Bradyrhizobium oligotrophicum S58]
MAVDRIPLRHREAGGRLDPEVNAIAVVFQELALLPHLSVAENIYLPHRKRALARLSEAECFEEARAALALVDEGPAAARARR